MRWANSFYCWFPLQSVWKVFGVNVVDQFLHNRVQYVLRSKDAMEHKRYVLAFSIPLQFYSMASLGFTIPIVADLEKDSICPMKRHIRSSILKMIDSISYQKVRIVLFDWNECFQSIDLFCVGDCSWSEIPGKIQPMLVFPTYRFLGNVTYNGTLCYQWDGCHTFEVNSYWAFEISVDRMEGEENWMKDFSLRSCRERVNLIERK